MFPALQRYSISLRSGNPFSRNKTEGWTMNWAKIAKRTLMIGAAVVLLLVGAAYIIIHTAAFNRFVLQQVVEQAQEATGSRVEIRSMQIHWDHLGVDLYGVVIHGNARQSTS